MMRLRELQMQGVTEYNFWITAYILLYGNDGVNWNAYLDDGINQTLSSKERNYNGAQQETIGPITNEI